MLQIQAYNRHALLREWLISHNNVITVEILHSKHFKTQKFWHFLKWTLLSIRNILLHFNRNHCQHSIAEEKLCKRIFQHKCKDIKQDNIIAHGN